MLLWLKPPASCQSGHNQKAEHLRNQFRQAASSRPNQALSALLVLVMACFVQFAGLSDAIGKDQPSKTNPEAQSSASGKATPAANPDRKTAAQSGGKQIPLPKNVAEMRDALLAAAQSARIEELRTPYDWNELPPAISDEKIDDPIAYWKSQSRDGQGLEILNTIHKLLSLPPAKLHVGKDHENNALYVWPYLAELDLSKLTPRQQFELRTLVPPKQARQIMESKKWTWWRLAIGADGTWHSFMKHKQ